MADKKQPGDDRDIFEKALSDENDPYRGIGPIGGAWGGMILGPIASLAFRRRGLNKFLKSETEKLGRKMTQQEEMRAINRYDTAIEKKTGKKYNGANGMVGGLLAGSAAGTAIETAVRRRRK